MSLPEFSPAVGGAGSPELARMTPDGRVYTDPLPWCPLLGQLGIAEAEFEPNAEFSSVTTLLGYLPKDKLVKWSAGQAAKAAVQYPWVMDLFGPDIAEWWYSTAGERSRDLAGARGSIVHDVAEDGHTILTKTADALLAGRDIDPRFLADTNTAAYVKGLQKFFATYPGIRPIWTEVTVFSRRFGYAGTLDLIAWVPGLGVVLIDYKASRFVLTHFSFQGAAYRWADYGIGDGVRVPIPPVEGFYIVHIMPGDEFDGAFEVVPADSHFELASDIMTAMRVVKKHDHGSRIGRPLAQSDLMSVASVAPTLTIVSPQRAAAAVAAATVSNEQLVELCRDPVDRLRDHRIVARDWQIAYVRDRAAALEAAMVDNDDAARRMRVLADWLAAKQLPSFDSDEMRNPDLHGDTVEQLVEGLAAADRALALPFGMKQPQPFDWDDLFGQLLDEHVNAAEEGLIVLGEDGDYHPAATRPTLNRNAVTLLRRGRSASDEDWSKPRDPDAVRLEADLLERANNLPADLVGELSAWAMGAGIPNLHLGVASSDQLRAIDGRVAELQQAHAERCDKLTDLRVAVGSFFCDDAGRAEADLFALVGVAGFPECTATQASTLERMMATLISGDIEHDSNGWSVKVDEASLVQQYGSKRDLLNAARKAAQVLELPAPKSSAMALTVPLIVAFLVTQAHAPGELAA